MIHDDVSHRKSILYHLLILDEELDKRDNYEEFD